MPTAVEQARNRYGAAARHHGLASVEAVAARANMTTEKVVAFLERVMADAPPLTDAQCDRIVGALGRPAALVASVDAPPSRE
jgi:hypothetical protein